MNIDVTVMCSECRAMLETDDDFRGGVHILVAPCPVCLGKARDEARQSGIDEGRDAGYGEGYEEGRVYGHRQGRAEAFMEQKGET